MSANEQIMIPASELVHEYVRLAKIEELEKIKTEIAHVINCCPNENTDLDISISIIDNYISELKGENKQSICNNCIYNNTEELSGECYACVKGIENWYVPLKENRE